MRLREIKDILEVNVDDLELVSKDIPNKSEVEISNLPELYESIMSVSEFDFISEDVAKLEKMPYIFHNKNPKAIISNAEFNKLTIIIDNINMKTNAVISAIGEAIPEQDKNSVSIKLPDFVDLKKISESIKEIDTILSQSLVGQYRGTIKLQNFDAGSNWIEVILANKEAVVLLGSIVKGTYEFIKEEYLVWKQMKNRIDSYEIEVGVREQMLKTMKDSVNAKARSHAIAIAKEFEITEGHAEYENGLTHSIITLAELIHEGAEVHTALNAPEEAKEVYPDAKEIRNLVDNAIKLLPEKPSDLPIDDSDSNGESKDNDEVEKTQEDKE